MVGFKTIVWEPVDVRDGYRDGIKERVPGLELFENKAQLMWAHEAPRQLILWVSAVVYPARAERTQVSTGRAFKRGAEILGGRALRSSS